MNKLEKAKMEFAALAERHGLAKVDKADEKIAIEIAIEEIADRCVYVFFDMMFRDVSHEATMVVTPQGVVKWRYGNLISDDEWNNRTPHELRIGGCGSSDIWLPSDHKTCTDTCSCGKCDSEENNNPECPECECADCMIQHYRDNLYAQKDREEYVAALKQWAPNNLSKKFLKESASV